MKKKLDVSKVNNHFCRKQVIEIVSKVAESDNIPDLVEEVEKLLDESIAFLFMNDEGFFILEPCKYKNLPSVNVLFAYNKSGNAICRYYDVIESLSNRIGAEYITAYTRHEGIYKLAKRIGFISFGKTNQDLIGFAKYIGGENGKR